MRVNRLDHLVLTVQDIERTCLFFSEVLGMAIVTFGNNRKALQFGQQKINLHESGKEFEPKAASPTSGSADLCFIVDDPIESVIEHLNAFNIEIIEGPVERTGATGRILSVYIRDPDFNLIELSNYMR